MKIAKTLIVVSIVLLIIVAETTKISILRRLEMGIPVSEYEPQVSGFLQSLSFAPVGLGIGFATLVFPQRVMASYDKFLGKMRATYSEIEMLGLRMLGVLFLSATLVALWTTGQFLLP